MAVQRNGLARLSSYFQTSFATGVCVLVDDFHQLPLRLLTRLHAFLQLLLQFLRSLISSGIVDCVQVVTDTLTCDAQRSRRLLDRSIGAHAPMVTWHRWCSNPSCAIAAFMLDWPTEVLTRERAIRAMSLKPTGLLPMQLQYLERFSMQAMY